MKFKVLVAEDDTVHMLDMPSGMRITGASFEDGYLALEVESDVELGGAVVFAVYGPVIEEDQWNLAGFDPLNEETVIV